METLLTTQSKTNAPNKASPAPKAPNMDLPAPEADQKINGKSTDALQPQDVPNQARSKEATDNILRDIRKALNFNQLREDINKLEAEKKGGLGGIEEEDEYISDDEDEEFESDDDNV